MLFLVILSTDMASFQSRELNWLLGLSNGRHNACVCRKENARKGRSSLAVFMRSAVERKKLTRRLKREVIPAGKEGLTVGVGGDNAGFVMLISAD